MYYIIRLIIASIILLCFTIVIKKAKTIMKTKLHIISICITLAFIVLLAHFPFENFFITFNSSKDAYEYVNIGDSNIELVVEGDNCDFVIDCKNDTDRYLIIPKTKNGWKIGIGADTKRIVQKTYNSTVIYVYQYKNTKDYFITVFDANEGALNIIDNCGSEFHSIMKENDYSGETFIIYFAHISSYGSQYNVQVNGTKIELNNK